MRSGVSRGMSSRPARSRCSHQALFSGPSLSSAARGSPPAPGGADRVDSRAGGDRVGDPRGRHRVVLEHLQEAVGAAHDVEPDHGGVRALHLHPHHVRLEVLGRRDQALGHHAVADRTQLAVGVGGELVQRPRALPQAALQLRPLGRGDDPGDHVQVELARAPGDAEVDVVLGAMRAQPRRQLLEVLFGERRQHSPVRAARLPGGVEGLVVAVRHVEPWRGVRAPCGHGPPSAAPLATGLLCPLRAHLSPSGSSRRASRRKRRPPRGVLA